jgi:hypothetical protein
MKRYLFSVLVLVLALALSACGNGAGGGSIPGGNLGDGELVLGGTVYYDDYDENVRKYTDPATVEVKTADGTTLGTAALLNGEFSVAITDKPASFFNVNELETYFYTVLAANADNYAGTFAFDPPDAGCMPIVLTYNAFGKNIYQAEYFESGITDNEHFVNYLYADRDVTITVQEGATLNHITLHRATLSLTKGWNALYLTDVYTWTDLTGNAFLSIERPDLKWLIE